MRWGNKYWIEQSKKILPHSLHYCFCLFIVEMNPPSCCCFTVLIFIKSTCQPVSYLLCMSHQSATREERNIVNNREPTQSSQNLLTKQKSMHNIGASPFKSLDRWQGGKERKEIEKLKHLFTWKWLQKEGVRGEEWTTQASQLNADNFRLFLDYSAVNGELH